MQPHNSLALLLLLLASPRTPSTTVLTMAVPTDSSSCAVAMQTAGCAKPPTQCDACAAENQHALRVARCTSDEIRQWCAAGRIVYDDFTTYNSSVWSYDDGSMGTTDKCKVWYLKNHSRVGADLSLGEGKGLMMLMSSTPCKQDPKYCHGAKMAADHVSSIANHLYGDYELRMRAPYAVNSTGGTCDKGIYAYFTAGYVNKAGKWNEMNFGFHPDRDNHGTEVSCEHHDDSGGYHETSVKLGFNYRESFNTYVIRLRKDSLTWLVGHGKQPHIQLKTVHHATAKLTEPMDTRLILRTNFRDGDPGYMPATAWEISHFKFTPA